MTAAEDLRAAGLSQRGVVAALVVAEACREDTRSGHVSWARLASVLGSSERTAARALAELRDLGIVTQLARGQRIALPATGARGGVSARYLLHVLPGRPDTQVSPGPTGPPDTQVSRDRAQPPDTQVSPGRPDHLTDRARPPDKSAPTTCHPGVTLPVAPVVPVAAAAASTSGPGTEHARAVGDIERRLGVSRDAAVLALADLLGGRRKPVQSIRGLVRSIPDGELLEHVVDGRRDENERDEAQQYAVIADDQAREHECQVCESGPGEDCTDIGTRAPITTVHGPRRRAAGYAAAGS